MKKLLALVVLALAGPLWAADYDVVVAGAGTGGSAAAIQAARMGAKVALLEPTRWVGGQMTAAGVTTLDDLTRNRSGLYGEFMNRLRRFYKEQGRNFAICYWGGDSTSGSADVEEQILLDLIAEAGDITLVRGATVQSLIFDAEGAVVGVKARTDAGEEVYRAPVTIDATELGDLLPLTGAPYRVGNSVWPEIDEQAQLQDITWVMPVAHLPEQAARLQARKPFDYHAMATKRFAPVVTPDGNTWGKGGYPYDLASFNAYRAYPDLQAEGKIRGDDPKTWGLITATSLNWGNDYPGRSSDRRGLKAKYLTDETYRRQANRGALMRTLGLLYYYQNELGQKDWTVDTRIGYADRGDDPLSQVDALPDWALEFARHMPPIPYARESRRLVGVHTLVAKEIYRKPGWDRSRNRFTSAIAVGEYPIDVHGSRRDDGIELDLGETGADFPPKWHAGRFQVPLEVLIPARLDGFLAAEKNISVSRLVNGATRLHPLTMLTGQAAGALAALSARTGLQPRRIPPVLVQQQLLKEGSMLALQFYADVGRGTPEWEEAQYAGMVALDPISKGFFGAALPLSDRHLRQAYERLGGRGTLELPHRWATKADAARAVSQLTGVDVEGDDTPATRQDFARMLYRAELEKAAKTVPGA